jgi:hypothetical protein
MQLKIAYVIEQLSLLSSGKIPFLFFAHGKVMCNMNTDCPVLIGKFQYINYD